MRKIYNIIIFVAILLIMAFPFVMAKVMGSEVQFVIELSYLYRAIITVLKGVI